MSVVLGRHAAAAVRAGAANTHAYPNAGAGSLPVSAGAAVMLAAADCSFDHQHELSADVTRLANAVCRRDVGQRECLPDREREPPRLDQITDLG
jgi:hypothetical protein